MDVTPIITIFKIVASEFKDIPDNTVGSWIKLTSPLVSKKRFGNLYEQALALLTAHRMKMANANMAVGDDPISDVGGIGVGNLMRVG